MAISVVGEGSVIATGDNVTDTTIFSVTVPSGADILICAYAGGMANSGTVDPTVISATYNGSAMVVEGAVGGFSSSTNRWPSLAFMYILSPASGTYDIVTTHSAIAADQTLYWWALTGVDTSDPFGATDYSEGDNTQSVTLSTTVTDSWLVAAAHLGDSTNPSNGTITWTSPTAEKFTTYENFMTQSVAVRVATSVGSYVVEATEAAGDDLTLAVIVVNPSAAGSVVEVSASLGRSIQTSLGRTAVMGAGIVASVSAGVQSGNAAQAIRDLTAALQTQVANTGDALAQAAMAAEIQSSAAVGADVAAEAALAALASMGYQSTAAVDADGSLTLAVSQGEEIQAGAVAATALLVGGLLSVALEGQILGAVGTYEATVAVDMTRALLATPTAVLAALAEVLEERGVQTSGLTDAGAGASLSFQLGHFNSVNVVITAGAELEAGVGTEFDGGTLVSGSVAIGQTEGAAVSGAVDSEAALAMITDVISVFSGSAAAVGASAFAVEYVFNTLGAAALFTVAAGRLFSVPSQDRWFTVQEQSRYFSVS